MKKTLLLTALLLKAQAHAEEIPPLEPSYLLESPKLEELPSPDLQLPKPYKSPFLAVGLSTIVPGLGQAYLGDFRSATGFFISSGALTGLSRIDSGFQMPSLITLQNLVSYNIYAAYRDVRAYNGNAGYPYPMPAETLSELALAPFSWSVIKKPEVWGGLLGAFAVVGVTTYFTMSEKMESKIPLSSNEEYFPLIAFPVAIGEESLFRGFLQSALYKSLTPVGSIVLSSLAFGAAHIPNAFVLDHEDRRDYFTVGLPLITAFGAYFGWLTYKNNSLKESVAVHAWYDFILFLGAYSVAQSAATRKPSFAFSFSY